MTFHLHLIYLHKNVNTDSSVLFCITLGSAWVSQVSKFNFWSLEFAWKTYFICFSFHFIFVISVVCFRLVNYLCVRDLCVLGFLMYSVVDYVISVVDSWTTIYLFYCFIVNFMSVIDLFTVYAKLCQINILTICYLEQFKSDMCGLLSILSG